MKLHWTLTLLTILCFSALALSQKIKPYHLDSQETDSVQFRTDIIRLALTGNDTTWYIPRGVLTNDSSTVPGHDSTFKWTIHKITHKKKVWYDTVVSPSFVFINDFLVDSIGQIVIIGCRADSNISTYSNESLPVSYNLIYPSVGLNCINSFLIKEGSAQFTFDSNGFLAIKRMSDNSIFFIQGTDTEFYTINSPQPLQSAEFSTVYAGKNDWYVYAVTSNLKGGYLLLHQQSDHLFAPVSSLPAQDSIGHWTGTLFVAKSGADYIVYDAVNPPAGPAEKYQYVKRLTSTILLLGKKDSDSWDYLEEKIIKHVCYVVAGTEAGKLKEIFYFPGNRKLWLARYERLMYFSSYDCKGKIPQLPIVVPVEKKLIPLYSEDSVGCFFIRYDAGTNILRLSQINIKKEILVKDDPIGLEFNVERVAVYKINYSKPRYLLVAQNLSANNRTALLLDWDADKFVFRSHQLIRSFTSMTLPQMNNRFFAVKEKDGYWHEFDLARSVIKDISILPDNSDVVSLSTVSAVGEGKRPRLYLKYRKSIGRWRLYAIR